MMDYELHGDGAAKTAIFTFGSYVNPNRTKPSYAFMKTCLAMKPKLSRRCDVYYFLSNSNDWYMSGVKGFARDVIGSAAALETIRQRHENVLCVGNSMGAFGALLFGYLISADDVVAFSPQTRLDRDFIARISERRWAEAIGGVQAAFDMNRFTIENVATEIGRRPPRAHVFAGADSPQDVAYAERLRPIENVAIHLVPGQGHDLVHAFRESGRLEEVLLDVIRQYDR